MLIKTNESNYITAFAIIGELAGENTIEIDNPTGYRLEHFQRYFYAYKYENEQLVFGEEVVVDAKQKKTLQEELNQIHKWFYDTDYIVMKVARGNWLATDERYVSYLAEYESKYTRKNEIEEILSR